MDGGACNVCCCSGFDASAPFCFAGPDIAVDEAVFSVGVALCTLILGGGPTSGDDVLDPSPFFAAAPTAALPLLELTAEGGGLFKRGETGHCGVLSPDEPPLPCSLDTASVTAPPPDNCGTLLADNALCIAAADGCVEKLGGPEGRESLRMGDVLREVRGLAPADGEEECGSRLLEDCLRSVGGLAVVVD